MRVLLSQGRSHLKQKWVEHLVNPNYRTKGNNRFKSLKDISGYWIFEHAGLFISDGKGNVFLLTASQKAKSVSINSQADVLKEWLEPKFANVDAVWKVYANLHCIFCLQYLNRMHFTKKVSLFCIFHLTGQLMIYSRSCLNFMSNFSHGRKMGLVGKYQPAFPSFHSGH